MSGNLDAKLDEAIRIYRLFTGSIQTSTTGAWLNLDLPIAQMRVLLILTLRHPTATVGMLGEELHIGLPAASRLVERLIREELVTRGEDPEDRRRILVRLSPRGEALMESIGGVMRDRMRSLLSQLPEDDLDALLRGLRALESIITQ